MRAVSSVARRKHSRLARIPVNAAPALARWRHSPGSQSFVMLTHDASVAALGTSPSLSAKTSSSRRTSPGCAIHSCSPELELVGRKPFGLFHRHSCLGGERFSLAATRVTSPVRLRLRCATQNAALLSRYSSGSAATLIRCPKASGPASLCRRLTSQTGFAICLVRGARLLSRLRVVPALTLTNAGHACLSVRLT